MVVARTPTSTSLRWSRKRLGVQRWQDGRIWGDAVPLWFSACHSRQPSVSHHAGVLFCAFPSLFCRPSSILRPIQSLTSECSRSSRPVDRCALVLRVSCRNLERAERFSIATLNDVRESEFGNKAKILGCCGRRSPSTDVRAADYGCLLVLKRQMARGNFTVSKTSTKLRTSLRRGKSPALEASRRSSPTGASDLHHRAPMHERLYQDRSHTGGLLLPLPCGP
jgi:hypothetical protein